MPKKKKEKEKGKGAETLRKPRRDSTRERSEKQEGKILKQEEGQQARPQAGPEVILGVTAAEPPLNLMRGCPGFSMRRLPL